MIKDLGYKIAASLVLTAALVFVGFIAYVFIGLTGGLLFYSPLVAAATLAIILISILSIFEVLKGKKLLAVFGILILLCAVSVTVYEVYNGYEKGIPRINDQGVDLHQYRPFRVDTKAVRLGEPSTLKIRSDLPKLDGATALYPLYSAFVQAVYPEKDYEPYKDSEVVCSSTPYAYSALIAGDVDIIFAAGPSQEQLDAAKNNGVELKLTPIGYEAFVFFVNSQNPVEGLTTGQIQKIYSGEITNWKEVGGKSEKIRAFQRPENSGSQTMLQKLMKGKNLMTPPRENVASGMGDIIEKTSDYRNYNNAIGYSFLFFATEMVKNNQIRLLSVDGVKPDRNTIKNKTYPLSAEFYAVTAGSQNPNVEPFIQWILSPQGQSIVEKTGYTPLN